MTQQEIRVLMREHPAVVDIVKDRLEGLMTPEMLKAARSISKLKGYRLERCMRFLEPLGNTTVDTLKRIM